MELTDAELLKELRKLRAEIPRLGTLVMQLGAFELFQRRADRVLGRAISALHERVLDKAISALAAPSTEQRIPADGWARVDYRYPTRVVNLYQHTTDATKPKELDDGT